jgi:tetratricopeptide (TPR) repeat protein
MSYKMTFWRWVFPALLAPTLSFAASASDATVALSPQLAATAFTCDACKIILLDPGSDEKTALDTQIAQTQARVKSGPNSAAQIERLGWLFVEKARVSNDPGFYKLAEQCALCLESAHGHSLDALLLKGHVLHSLHRFKEAESLALELTEKRELAFDFGLLGDVEYDQGKVPQAVAAYQRMVNLRPDLQAYSRIAQIRWITGDLSGAVDAMALAAQAGSPLNAEPTAWTYARLALLQLQVGDLPAAKQSAFVALQMQTNSAPAWLALGRVQLAAGEINAAVESLRKAAGLNHLPEAQWALADALRLAGQFSAAEDVEKKLQQRGASEDPRSFSLFLSTRGQQPELALKLAQSELNARTDVFTHDALAWALKASGRLPEARAEMTKALAEGTQDARLFFHSAVIAAAAGDQGGAARYSSLAWKFQQMLFPSERELLGRIAPGGKYSQQYSSNLEHD